MIMRRIAATTAIALTCLLSPTLSAAEPIVERGYTAGCGEEGCFLQAAGFIFFVPAGDTPRDILDTLASLPPVSAVAFEGEMFNMGDSSADLILTRVTRIADDPYEGNLQAMQGIWEPQGEEMAFRVEIIGLTWTEYVQEEHGGDFIISAGAACADGVEPGGMAISLYLLGDDPAADACWQLEFIDDSVMQLRDITGLQGQVGFDRVEG